MTKAERKKIEESFQGPTQEDSRRFRKWYKKWYLKHKGKLMKKVNGGCKIHGGGKLEVGSDKSH